MNPNDADESFLEPVFAEKQLPMAAALGRLTEYLKRLKLPLDHGLTEKGIRALEADLHDQAERWPEMSFNFVQLRTFGVNISMGKSRFLRKPEINGFFNCSTAYTAGEDSWLHDFDYMAGPRDFRVPKLHHTAKFVDEKIRNSEYPGAEYTITGLLQFLTLREIETQIRSKFPEIIAIGFVIQPRYWYDFKQGRALQS